MRSSIYLIIFLLLLVGIALACTREKRTKYAGYEYQQTFCSDPWGYGTTDSLTLRKFIRYMDSVGVYVASASLDSAKTPEVCNACPCKSGKLFRLTTFDDAQEDTRLKSYNFVRQP